MAPFQQLETKSLVKFLRANITFRAMADAFISGVGSERQTAGVLGNLSYQFFGKVNDPDTARYYERFFELVKIPTRSVSKSSGLNLELRITEGEKEVSKRRAEVFFRLKQGEFVIFADGKDCKEQFPRPVIERTLPKPLEIKEGDLERHYLKVHQEVGSMFT